MREEPLRQERFEPARQDEAGQQMIEFTFTFMMIIGVMAAVILFAVLFFQQASIMHAAQTGSRHLLTYPRVPDDEDTFDTADAEAMWVITNTVPWLDWELMEITIDPPAEQRLLGTYVAVQIKYPAPLPTIELPYIITEGAFVLLPPIELSALSRRALNW
jgi:hypothetical protein